MILIPYAALVLLALFVGGYLFLKHTHVDLRAGLEKNGSSRAADVIVVFGAAVRKDGSAGPALQRRIECGIDAYRLGLAPRTILTGGMGRYPPAEATVMRDLAIRDGIPEQVIVIEDQSNTTLQSVLHCIEIMRAHEWNRIHVITDGFHLPRCIMAFWLLGIPATGTACGNSWTDCSFTFRFRQYCREALAIPWYFFRCAWIRLKRRNTCRTH